MSDNSLDETKISFAFVCWGSLKDFEAIRTYILNCLRTRLIYQTKSLEKLFIQKESERDGRDGRF